MVADSRVVLILSFSLPPSPFPPPPPHLSLSLSLPPSFRTHRIVSPTFGDFTITYTGDCVCDCATSQVSQSYMYIPYIHVQVITTGQGLGSHFRVAYWNIHENANTYNIIMLYYKLILYLFE